MFVCSLFNLSFLFLQYLFFKTFLLFFLNIILIIAKLFVTFHVNVSDNLNLRSFETNLNFNLLLYYLLSFLAIYSNICIMSYFYVLVGMQVELSIILTGLL